MKLLSLNCGSSSLKAALIDTVRGVRLIDVRVTEIGSAHSQLQIDGSPTAPGTAMDFASAVRRVILEIVDRASALGAIDAVAHRVVHGGVRFRQPTLLVEAVLADLKKLDVLAPLHNPPALAAICEARILLRDVPHIAVFDTAFHSTLPNRARHYALPPSLSESFDIRRFGFHGTSHSHVMHTAATFLCTQPQQLRIISCHLGNGASAVAIEYGCSVETSMGMTPLEGLVMGTRCGDIDPGVLLQLQRAGNFDVDRLDRLLNAESGLKGMTGSNDLRELEQRADSGDASCRLAIGIYAHRVRKYIGAYAAVMGGVDVIAFTGGIGENSAPMRHRIAQRLDFLGARLNEDRNRNAHVSASMPVADISDAQSRTRILVIRADEEMSLALQADSFLRAVNAPALDRTVPICISARHAHLSQVTINLVFGPNYALQPRKELSQHGQYAASETIALIGPRGRIDQVRLMGPPRDQDQIEISRSDEFTLGVDAPVRISGDLANTPGITLEGPSGRATITHGLIAARRHIHMNPADAQRLGVSDHDTVNVRVDSEGRDLIFGDVVVRVAPAFELAMHLDTDEANAAGITPGMKGEIIPRNTAFNEELGLPNGDTVGSAP